MACALVKFYGTRIYQDAWSGQRFRFYRLPETEHRQFRIAIARKLCDRRFGIGADQLLTVQPSKVADFKMEIYNADGSEVEMCGNGIRCFAKYVYDHGITTKRALEVETLAGIIRPRMVGEAVEVDMGEPILDGRKIPVDADGEIKNRPLMVDGKTYEVTCLSMGNPHCVLYLDDIDSLDLEKIGPALRASPVLSPNG